MIFCEGKIGKIAILNEEKLWNFKMEIYSWASNILWTEIWQRKLLSQQGRNVP